MPIYPPITDLAWQDDDAPDIIPWKRIYGEYREDDVTLQQTDYQYLALVEEDDFPDRADKYKPSKVMEEWNKLDSDQKQAPKPYDNDVPDMVSLQGTKEWREKLFVNPEVTDLDKIAEFNKQLNECYRLTRVSELWQAVILCARVALVRTTMFGYKIKAEGYTYDVDTYQPLTHPSSWYRVNKRLKNDETLRNKLLESDYVRDRAEQMQKNLALFFKLMGVQAMYTQTVEQLMQPPYPKAVWCGKLPSLKLPDDPPHGFTPDHDTSDVALAFHHNAQAFRGAVGGVIHKYLLDKKLGQDE